MAEDPAGSITEVFERLRTGDADAAARLWDRFFPRLQGLARRTLAGRPQRGADADDAVQSAFASFFLRVRAGAFPADLDRNDLWKLLAVITQRKSLQQNRREQAAKRGAGRVLGEGDVPQPDGAGPFGLDGLPGNVPCADFDLACAELLDLLEEEERTIALLRLLGHRNRDIARQLVCTERKVERKLHLIRLTWERFLED